MEQRDTMSEEELKEPKNARELDAGQEDAQAGKRKLDKQIPIGGDDGPVFIDERPEPEKVR